MQRFSKISLIVLCLALMVSAVACSNVNKANYDKLSLGMDYAEVTAILGQPDKTKDVLGGKNCMWGDESKNINVKFVSDKVVFFSATGIQ